MQSLNDNKTTLSVMPSGSRCVITKINGHGSFRHRIMEMGFVKGEIVTVVKNAPLRDPIEYEVMGSHISLRRSEALQIEVSDISACESGATSFSTFTEEVQKNIKEKSNIINVALVGNPNCGKTSFFNFATGLHEKVGNYSGVTVNAKIGTFNYNGYTINMIDLPGTYSITEYSPEELYVRQYICEESPDIVLNVVDSSNLERNLFLTTQLIDMNVRIVMALNMYDEFQKSGSRLDYEYLGSMLGFNIVPTVAFKGVGINEVLDSIINTYEDRANTHKHIHINYGKDIEDEITRIKKSIVLNKEVTDKYSSRYLALKLLEDDKTTLEVFKGRDNYSDIVSVSERSRKHLREVHKEEPSEVITNAKYGFIRGALKETYVPPMSSKKNLSSKIDNILTNRWLGFPILFLFLYIMFQSTFSLGAIPQGWIERGVELLATWLLSVLPSGIVSDLLINGIIEGVGSVLVFLPNILILFLFISIMEDTGYMARAAFIMDKLMHKIGLHGKSFIPLLIGFGCSVPAIMATRILENKKNRIVTMLIIPLMSCSARLPVYILLVSAFFPKNQALILLGLYLVGILLAILIALIMKKFFYKSDSEQFVMELPPYRFPSFRNLMIHIWDRVAEYLKKISSVILIASVIIWVLGYFPRTSAATDAIDSQIALLEADAANADAVQMAKIESLQLQRSLVQKENSYIGKIGKVIEPVMAPLGFDWKMSVSLVTGFAAKEIVVSSMGILYKVEDAENITSLSKALQSEVYATGPRAGQKVFSPLVAMAFMLFVLLYVPCTATIITCGKEFGRKWAWIMSGYTFALAWIVAFLVFQVGSLLGLGL
ncbi:MAG: ferrous iron transport protein B [Bacteroidales bacterium]|nr:ferrous iron transport protein B [Bacteroidales bacterium]